MDRWEIRNNLRWRGIRKAWPKQRVIKELRARLRVAAKAFDEGLKDIDRCVDRRVQSYLRQLDVGGRERAKLSSIQGMQHDIDRLEGRVKALSDKLDNLRVTKADYWPGNDGYETNGLGK